MYSLNNTTDAGIIIINAKSVASELSKKAGKAIDISKLKLGRANFLSAYKPLMAEEKHSKDLFVIQSKKKFKNNDDVTSEVL